MPIRVDQHESVCVVAVDADLRGEETTAAFRTVVGEAIDAGAPVSAVVVDFSGIKYVDSRGLDALLWCRNRLPEGARSVCLAGLDSNCRKIFEITRLDDCFEIHPNVQAALKAVA